MNISALGFLNPRNISQTFSAFRYKDYRLLWLGQLGSGFAQQGEMLTRSWLVYELTGSGAMLAIAHATRMLGTLIVTPLGGVLTDRVDRRIILILANAANAASFAGIGILVLLEWASPWHVILSAVIAGGAMSLQMTASQAVIPSLVPRDGMMNAMSLHAMTMGIDRVAGPLLAGFLIATVGVEGAYFAATSALLLPVFLYWFIRPLKIASESSNDSYLKSFTEGVKFAIHNPAVRIVALATAVTVSIGMPFLQMLPMYVTDVLQMGPATVGTLLALPGILTIIGGLWAASIGDFKYKGVLLFISCAGPCITTVALGLTGNFWAAMAAMAFFSAAASQYGPNSRTISMKATPEEYRGRVSSMLALTLGMSSAGIVINGFMADLVGIQTTFLIFGTIALVVNILLFVGMPEYRKLN